MRSLDRLHYAETVRGRSGSLDEYRLHFCESLL
nr:MAG TPA: hypothetical protein [Caudoviricetes sp.]